MKLDPISLSRIELLHPAIRLKVSEWLVNCSTCNVGVRITQAFRTIQEQDQLFAKGRTKKGHIVTNARGGFSWHNYGLAFDFALYRKNGSVSWNMLEDLDQDGMSDWMEAVNVAKALEFGWGGDWFGDFKDYPHFDMRFGLTIHQAKERFEKGLTDKNGFIYMKRD